MSSNRKRGNNGNNQKAPCGRKKVDNKTTMKIKMSSGVTRKPDQREGKNDRKQTPGKYYLLRTGNGDFCIKKTGKETSNFIKQAGGRSHFQICKLFNTETGAKAFMKNILEGGVNATETIHNNARMKEQSNNGDMMKVLRKNSRRANVQLMYFDKEYSKHIIVVYLYSNKLKLDDWRHKEPIISSVLHAVYETQKNQIFHHDAYQTATSFDRRDANSGAPKLMQSYNKKTNKYWRKRAIVFKVTPARNESKQHAIEVFGNKLKHLLSSDVFKLGYSEALEIDGMMAVYNKMGRESSPFWDDLRAVNIEIRKVTDFGDYFMPDMISKLEAMLLLDD